MDHNPPKDANIPEIRGSMHDDIIYSPLGGANISSFAGNDIIYGSANSDTISGGIGNDTIYGGGGRDYIHAGNGNDFVHHHGLGGLVGLGNGKDTLDVAKTGYGQFHIYSGDGSSKITADLTNNEGWGQIGRAHV